MASNIDTLQVKVSSSDTTENYLEDKIEAGDNITITKTSTLGVETLTISAVDQITSSSELQEKIKVSSDDTTSQYLENKIIAGDNVTIENKSVGGVEYLEVSTSSAVYDDEFTDLQEQIDDLDTITSNTNQTVDEHYIQHSDAIDTIRKDMDGYQSQIDGISQTVDEHYIQHSDAIDTIRKDCDGYQSQIDGISQTVDEHYIQHSDAIDIIRKDCDGYQDQISSNWTNSSEQRQDIRDSLDGYVETTEWGINGFEDRDDSTLTWTDTSPDRTLSIQPTATNFKYWVDGIEYTSTGDTVQISDDEGIHVIYYDDDTLTEILSPTIGEVGVIIRTKAIVSIVYWDFSGQTAIYVGEERHGKVMSPETHAYLHFTEGLRYLYGLGLSDMDVDGDGDDETAAQFGVSAGGISDEDLYIEVDAVASTTGLPIYYMLGASAEWQKHTEAGFSVRTFDGTSSTRLAWNQYTGGAWQLTEVTNNDYVLCHVFATTEKDKPMIAIMGQNVYSGKSKARTGANTEINSLLLNDILFPEIKPIATVIFNTNNLWDNTVKAKVVSTDDGDNYVDWRNEAISRVALSTSDHNALTGLQGGSSGEYYHLTSSEYSDLASASTELQRWIDSSEQRQDIRDSLDGYVLTDGSRNVTGSLTIETDLTVQGDFIGHNIELDEDGYVAGCLTSGCSRNINSGTITRVSGLVSEIVIGPRTIVINRDVDDIITGWEDDDYEWELTNEDGYIVKWEVIEK